MVRPLDRSIERCCAGHNSFVNVFISVNILRANRRISSGELVQHLTQWSNGQAIGRLVVHAVIMHEFGTAAVLRPGEFPNPAPRPGWVTVALRASALNWHDVLVRQGRYGSPLPHIIGADGAGVRTDTGEPVVVLPSLNWGDRDEAPGSSWEILGDHTAGTYAELVSVPADCVAA